ncbi:MAG: right-handed parallel beta-helix repeat-containing protein [Phycisphaerae bacterium]
MSPGRRRQSSLSIPSRHCPAVFVSAAWLLVTLPATAQTTWFVDDDGAAGNGCTSWADACPDLQTALGLAGPGDAIWVADGTYRPAGPGGDRAATFQLNNGVALYGGFDGTETTLAERAGLFDRTILSGDLNGNDGPGFANITDNSRHVVTVVGPNAITILDGFAITGGNSVDFPQDGGGGMLIDGSSPAVRNCRLLENAAPVGGAILNTYHGAPTFTNCRFSGNAAAAGGAMYNGLGTGTIVTHCTFSGNSASRGGALFNTEGSTPIVINSRFSGNAANRGGAMENTNFSDTTVINCTFSGNSGDLGGALFHNSANSTVTNCIFWNNPGGAILFATNSIVTYSNVEGGFVGAGNIDADPLFVDPLGPDGVAGTEDDDLRLQAGSPCIDAGDNTAVPADIADLDGDGDTTERTPLDLAGNPRFVDDPATVDTGIPDPPDYPGVVDMGAFEFEICGLTGDVNGDSMVDGADIQGFVECVVTGAGTCLCADIDGLDGPTIDDVGLFVILLLNP